MQTNKRMTDCAIMPLHICIFNILLRVHAKSYTYAYARVYAKRFLIKKRIYNTSSAYDEILINI